MRAPVPGARAGSGGAACPHAPQGLLIPPGREQPLPAQRTSLCRCSSQGTGEQAVWGGGPQPGPGPGVWEGRSPGLDPWPLCWRTRWRWTVTFTESGPEPPVGCRADETLTLNVRIWAEGGGGVRSRVCLPGRRAGPDAGSRARRRRACGASAGPRRVCCCGGHLAGRPPAAALAALSPTFESVNKHLFIVSI